MLYYQGVFVVTYFTMLRGPCSDACMKSPTAADEKSQHNVSAERYQSTLMVNTESEEQMLHLPQIQYPSPTSHLTKSREMLVPSQHTDPRQVCIVLAIEFYI